MKRFYLLVLIYIFINISVSSAKVAERTMFVRSGELRNLQSVKKSEYSSLEVLRGDSIKFTAVWDDLSKINYYYLWQMSTDAESWSVVNPYNFEDNEYEEVVLEEGVKYYRVVVLTDYSLYFQYDNIEDCEDCKISDIVEVITKSLDLTYEVLNPEPCLVTETLNLRFYVKNPLSRAVENVKVNIEVLSVEALRISALEDSSSFNDSILQWNVGTLLADETKTIDIAVKSPMYYFSLGVYVSTVESLRWRDYVYASTKVYVEEMFREYIGDSYSFYTAEICGSLTPNIVDIATCCGITSSDIRFYEDEERQKEAISIDTSIPTPKEGKTYYIVGVDKSGCESKMTDFKLIVREAPKIVKAEPEDTILCNIDGEMVDRATINYKIEGGIPPYTIYYSSYDINNPDYYINNFVTVQSAEGSFDVFPLMSSEYKITSIYSHDYCWTDQEVAPFRIYMPRTHKCYVSTLLDYKLVGEDYKVSFDDIDGEFDTYQWQVSYDNGNTFEDLIDTVNPEVDTINVVSGAQTSELKISNLDAMQDVARYRVKLSNSRIPCIVNYSSSSMLRMYNYSMLALNIFSEDVSEEYICENEKVELRCDIFNGEAKVYEGMEVKLDFSVPLEDLVVIPSNGTYDYETSIWSIDTLGIGRHEDISISFNATEDAIIRFNCGSDSISASFNVLGTPVIGTLQTPEPVCEGANLCATVPDIQEGYDVTDVIWHLDDELIDLGAVLSKENNGSMLQCEVVNKCGSTMSNKVQIEVKGVPEIGMLDEGIYSVCEGVPLNLSNPKIETYGNTDIKGRWVLNGETYIEGTPVYKTNDKYYELRYEVEGECGGVIKSPRDYYFVVLEGIKLGELKTPEPICDQSLFFPTAPIISLKGTNFISERWVLDGEEYDGDIITHEKNGKKLYYEVTQSCNGKESVVRSNEVELTVIPPIEIPDIPEVYEYEEGKALNLPNPIVGYAIEPNDVIKYNSKWTLFDEDESVVVEDYKGQPIYDGEMIKQARYEVRSMVYLSPEVQYTCEHMYSNAAKLIPEVATALEVVMADEDETVWATAITPYNQNGLNDTFAEGMHVKVFDSRLQQIFEGDNGWDGTANMGSRGVGAIQPPGVYYYCVITPDGEKKLGLIEIVRM